MSNLSQVELQYLRQFVGSACTCNTKLTDYANTAVDPQVKQLFTKASQDSLNTKQTLMTFLQN